jgi:hypothetical protein
MAFQTPFRGRGMEIIASYQLLTRQNTLKIQAKATDSPFWKGLMGVEGDFFQRGSFVMGDGTRTRFWEDF